MDVRVFPRDLLTLCLERYSQIDLAHKLNVTPRTIRFWETGDNSPPEYHSNQLQYLLSGRGQGVQRCHDFTFIDLFAGIGGIRKAFEDNGGSCVFTSEWNKYAVKTYCENFVTNHPVAGDITTVAAKDIPHHDVLLAGFPCQPFSIAGVSKKNSLGRVHGFKCNIQGTLFFDVARIINEKKPVAFLLENVKNLMSHDKGRTFQIIQETLTEELGYYIFPKVIDAKGFVPQHRERIYIVGFKSETNFSWDSFCGFKPDAKKMRDILHPQEAEKTNLDSYSKFLDSKTGEVYDKYVLSDKLWKYLFDYAAKHKARGNGFGFGMVGPDSIARTLSARYYKDGSEILVQRSM